MGDGMRGVEQMRMKTIDKVGVVEKLKELKTPIRTSYGRKMGNFQKTIFVS